MKSSFISGGVVIRTELTRKNDRVATVIPGEAALNREHFIVVSMELGASESEAIEEWDSLTDWEFCDDS